MAEQPKMNPEAKALWLKDLRSGEYKQADAVLCDGKNGYCCLGVLTKIYGEQTKTQVFDSEGQYALADIDVQWLPERVVKWAGLEGFVVTSDRNDGSSYETTYNIKANKKHVASLADHNDAKKSFKYIADLIDKHM